MMFARTLWACSLGVFRIDPNIIQLLTDASPNIAIVTAGTA